VRWTDDSTSDGVRHRHFLLERGERAIPAALWTPEGATGPRPLVLIGHGGSGHKSQDYVLGLARRLVGRYGFAAAAIDGPVHGDRRLRPDPDGRLGFLEFAQAWANDPAMTAEMTADWRATLAAVRSLDEVGESAAGYWGVSMGTILGLPFVAAEPAVSVAVLGLMGLTGPTRSEVEQAAIALRCPVLFLVQWSDELFSRETAFELFELLGSDDKTLHANPGRHGEVPLAEFRQSEAFLVRHLRG
jgi:dienelactone hydrolase